MLHDSWSIQEAMSIFAGIDPASDGLRYTRGTLLPLYQDPFEFDEVSAGEIYENLWDIWRSGWNAGVHNPDQEHFSVRYFIDWAISKKVIIPWLHWAKEEKLFDAAEDFQFPTTDPQVHNKPISELQEAKDPIADLESALATESNLRITDTEAKIKGDTHARLQRAIDSFTSRYPDYVTKPPKLDADVRPWLKESELAESDAERRVFGAIIREHFKLSPDT
jgi:hypothetical protein